MSDAHPTPGSDPDDPEPDADPAGPALDRADVDLDVPADAEVYDCDRCGERFPRERQRDLHLGLEHGGALSDAEREAYARATAEEGDDLRRFRIVSLGLLVLLYFGFLFLYAVAGTGSAATATAGVVAAVRLGPPARRR